MNTKSPHTTISTSSNPTEVTSRLHERHIGSVRPTGAVRERTRVGRFDTGMSTHPGKTLDRIGRFDTGMSTHPGKTLDRIGRFDTGMSTHPGKTLDRIGRFDTGMSQRSTTPEVGGRLDDSGFDDALAA
jgi:hypothetical protein